MKTLILCPTETDLNSVFNVLDDFSCSTSYNVTAGNNFKVDYYETNILKDTIYIAKCGTGRALSILTTTLLLDTLKVNKIIVCGTCYGVSHATLYDTFFIKEAEFLDFDTLDSCNIWGVDNSDKDLLTYVNPKQKTYGLPEAKCFSADHFIRNKDINEIKKKEIKNQSIVMDMETANIFMCAKVYNIPHIAIRTVSNLGGVQKYDSKEKQASKKAAYFALKHASKNACFVDYCFLDIYPDFPKKGVNFVDISSITENPIYFKEIIQSIISNLPFKPTKIIGIDARGFIFASAVAYELGVPLIMARKKGKLPGDCVQLNYTKEYGDDVLELRNNINVDDYVLVIDDIGFTYNTVSCVLDYTQKYAKDVRAIIVCGLQECKDKRIQCLIESDML